MATQLIRNCPELAVPESRQPVFRGAAIAADLVDTSNGRTVPHHAP